MGTIPLPVGVQQCLETFGVITMGGEAGEVCTSMPRQRPGLLVTSQQRTGQPPTTHFRPKMSVVLRLGNTSLCPRPAETEFIPKPFLSIQKKLQLSTPPVTPGQSSLRSSQWPLHWCPCCPSLSLAVCLIPQKKQLWYCHFCCSQAPKSTVLAQGQRVNAVWRDRNRTDPTQSWVWVLAQHFLTVAPQWLSLPKSQSLG